MAEETNVFQTELSAEEAAKQEAMLEKHEKSTRTRKFGSPVMNKGLSLFCFLFTVYHLVIASGLVSIQNLKHHAIHVGLILILSFVLYPAWEKASRKKIAWYDYIFTAIAVAEPIYVFLRYDAFISTGFKPSMVDLIMGTLLVILVLEATRRISGAALPILCIIFLLPDYHRCGADHDDYQLLPRLRGGRDAAGSFPADDCGAHRATGKPADSHFSWSAVPDPKISVYLKN